MKNTLVLTITQVYNFDRAPWSYTDDKGDEHELETITGEAVDDAGKVWCVYTNCIPKSYDFRKGDLEKLVEREAYFLVDNTGKSTRKGVPKLKILGYPGGRGENSEGLSIIGGEKTVEGSGAVQGEGPQQGETPEPESSGEGGEQPPAAAVLTTPPSSEPLDDITEAWAEAMRQFGVGSRGPVIVALRRMLDHPIDASAVTEAELYDVIAAKGEQG